MKWMKAIACTALLALSGPALSDEGQTESPRDYAFGRSLDTSAPSQWYRVMLPLAVYAQSTSPDLHDVRVFNRSGEPVPFSLIAATRPQASVQSTALRLFPLDASPLAPASDAGDSDKILLRSRNGVEIVLEGQKAAAAGQHYLLTLPEQASGELAVSQLQLLWDTPQSSWQGTASVYYSEDLKRWYTLGEDMPLLDVASGQDRLKLDRIDTETVLSPDANRYLMVVLNAQSQGVTLTGVNAISAPAQADPEEINLEGEGEPLSASEAMWRWARPQPLRAVSISLNGDGVLPVDIAWRSSEKDAWHPLKKEVIYRLEGKTSGPVSLGGGLVQAVKITTLNARLPEYLPGVTGHRDRYDLVFNAQGKAPFVLAWGNGAAKPANVEPDMLIPAELRKTYDMANLPQADVVDDVALGGEARLTATSAADRESRRNTLLVWGVLIAGVILLAGMAWRIWREVQRKA
ncbi:TPA: DUF3999 domain-containing protein [Enterobacter chengduensis]|uniref:Membrane protein n=1 Tax=Enterobacter chengduensis TaxID=2494701 RepID=A0AAW3HNR0_9ENTR|nr:DUF3999 domain-containing protein [Enterobacter chengduensis]KDF50449.1 hypothetical protein AE07_00149 [Enterobacter cloacae BWH 43]OTW36128.1 hypothetical protein CAP57_05030 [Enterobacter kobei]GJL41349.1 membrane protein [Enterobacter asburiae]KJX38935.1 membrane protein [Enterobacter chengduensis]MBN9879112.1 DUF3999 domain-containing protein [Enterobacter chengduensis]